jgi:hypothetical protein
MAGEREEGGVEDGGAGGVSRSEGECAEGAKSDELLELEQLVREQKLSRQV